MRAIGEPGIADGGMILTDRAWPARAALDRIVPARALAGMLFGLLAIPQLLLWRFLGFGLPALCLGAVAMAALGAGVTRALPAARGPTVRLVAIAALIAFVLLLLGGEGRFFYANPDWKIRDAVMHDLVLDPWPWAYVVHGTPEVLRAPIAMYLLPALAGKAGGPRAADLALLAQDGALLAGLLALGSTLFATTRRRVAAAALFLGFSGMDLIGVALAGGRLYGHLEWWTASQFSSHVTQAFWVPQHALAGWTGALLYMLWRERRIALAGFLAPLPLLALWSPLALMGLMPFAVHAGVVTLARRDLRLADIALPALACAVALPGLLYLVADSGSVGGGSSTLSVPGYLKFEALEIGPYLLAMLFVGRRQRFGGATFAIVAVTLLIAPWIRIGESSDFAMRATIPALAILAVAIADLLATPAVARGREAWRGILVATLTIGAATPLTEIGRALVLPTSPAPLCGYFGLHPDGFSTYTAPLARLPRPIAPAAPALLPLHEPHRCWDRQWPGATVTPEVQARGRKWADMQ